MSHKPAKAQSEADLETAIAAAIAAAFPRLKSADIKHQVEFTIRLGHAQITPSGRRSWTRRGRADVLLAYHDKPLAVIELKKPSVPIEPGDAEQGLSYARLLPVMAPFVVVTNGGTTEIFETFTGSPWEADTPDARAFEALMASTAKVAAGDRDAAIATLMGADPEVWTRAIAIASEFAVAELTGDAQSPLRPFGPLKIPRLATYDVGRKLAEGARLVLVSGPPVSGKSNILEQLVRGAEPDVAGGLFLECGASEVFRKIADVLADVLDWSVDPEAARSWVRRLSRSDGPLLIIAIDHLDPEDRDDVRMIEDLSSNAFGSRLRVVVAVDDGSMQSLLSGKNGRHESPTGRRAEVVEVTDLADIEFSKALAALAGLDIGIMDGGHYSRDLRQPWLLQAMATRLSGLDRDRLSVLPAVPGLEILSQARKNFPDPELRRRYRGLASAIAEDAQDQEKPHAMAVQLISRYFIRRETLDRTLQPADAGWLLRHGYLTPSIGNENIPIVTIALPELLASELAYYLAAELRPMVDKDPKQAAEWLSGAASNFLFGDIIAAQAVLDLASGNGRVPIALYDALIELAPRREAARAGQQLVTWIKDIGQVDIRPQEDGYSIVTINGEDHVVDNDGTGAGSYVDSHSWLILSHLASRRFVVERDGVQRRLDPEALLIIGTADVVLRQSRNDILMDSLPTHDTGDGGEYVCHKAGIVEAVTQSILKYLNNEEHEDRDVFVRYAIEIDCVYLTARLDNALRMLVRSANPDLSRWAEQTLANSVGPALRRHVGDH